MVYQENKRKKGKRFKARKFSFGKIFLYLVLLASVIASVYSAKIIFDETKQKEEFKKEEKEVEELAFGPATSEEEKKKDLKFGIDFNALLEKNKDTIGWIKFPEEGDLSNINFPLVQTTNNDTYIWKGFTGKGNNSYGTIFLQAGANSNFVGNTHSTLFGHRNSASDQIHFTKLRKYVTGGKKYYNQNKTFDVITKDGTKLTYEIFAVLDIPITDKVLERFTYTPKKQQNEFNRYLKEHSVYDTGVGLSEGDKVLSLYSCKPFERGNDVGRYIISGKLISAEKAS